jgi:hypothetical protein
MSPHQHGIHGIRTPKMCWRKYRKRCANGVRPGKSNIGTRKGALVCNMTYRRKRQITRTSLWSHVITFQLHPGADRSYILTCKDRAGKASFMRRVTRMWSKSACRAQKCERKQANQLDARDETKWKWWKAA